MTSKWTSATYRQSLTLRAFQFLAACCVLMALAMANVDSAITSPDVAAKDDVDLSGAAALLEQHGCWTDAAPADVVRPHHVVVTVGTRTFYAGRAMTEKALDQQFGGTDHGLIVRGFCR